MFIQYIHLYMKEETTNLHLLFIILSCLIFKCQLSIYWTLAKNLIVGYPFIFRTA